MEFETFEISSNCPLSTTFNSLSKAKDQVKETSCKMKTTTLLSVVVAEKCLLFLDFSGERRISSHTVVNISFKDTLLCLSVTSIVAAG